MAAHDRLLGQHCLVTITSEPPVDQLDQLTLEVDEVRGRYVPQIATTWPIGEASQHDQITGEHAEVTLSGGQTGGGMLRLAKIQTQARKAGRALPRYALHITGAEPGGTRIDVRFKNGIITDAGITVRGGNDAVMNEGSFKFADLG